MIDNIVRKRIQHLYNYISDKTAIMQHVSRELSVTLTLRDIDEAISDINTREYRPNLTPMTPSPLIVTHNYKGHDPLAKALFAYHAKRSTGAARAYWLDRLNDNTPKPSTTIQL